MRHLYFLTLSKISILRHSFLLFACLLSILFQALLAAFLSSVTSQVMSGAESVVIPNVSLSLTIRDFLVISIAIVAIAGISRIVYIRSILLAAAISGERIMQSGYNRCMNERDPNKRITFRDTFLLISERFCNTVISQIYQSTYQLVTLLVALTICFFIDKILTITSILTIFAFYPFVSLINRRLRGGFSRIICRNQNLLSRFFSADFAQFPNQEQAYFGSGNGFASDFRIYNSEYRRAHLLNQLLPQNLRTFVDTIVAVLVVEWVTLIYLGLGDVTTFIGFFFVFARAMQALAQLSSGFLIVKRSMIEDKQFIDIARTSKLKNKDIKPVKEIDRVIFGSVKTGYHKKDFELEIIPGIILIKGPSGSGKTSIMRAIAGITQSHVSVSSSHSSVYYMSQDITLFDVGLGANIFMTQDFTKILLPENVFLRKRLTDLMMSLGIPSFFGMKYISGISDLSHLLNRSCNNLSGGQCQRICLLRALMSTSNILLLDEPFSALDRKSAEDSLNTIIIESKARTICITDHTDLAQSICKSTKEIDLR